MMKPEFIALTFAVVTDHLTFLGQVLQWLCIFTDTTDGFGLWLRLHWLAPVEPLFLLVFQIRVLWAYRPSAQLSIFPDGRRFGLRLADSATLTNFRQIGANLLIHFHRPHNNLSRLGLQGGKIRFQYGLLLG